MMFILMIEGTKKYAMKKFLSQGFLNAFVVSL